FNEYIVGHRSLLFRSILQAILWSLASLPCQIPRSRLQECMIAHTDSLLLAVLVVRLVGPQRVQQGTHILKEGFAASQLLLDIGVVKLSKGDIVALLAIPKEAVIQFAMMFGESARLDEFPVEGCTHPAVFRELVPLFQEEGAHRIEQG